MTDTAWGESLEEGIGQGRLEALVATAKKQLGQLDDLAISEATGLSVDEVAVLRG